MFLYRIFVQKTLGKSYLKMNNRSKVQGSDLPAGRPAHRNTMEGVEAGRGRFFCEKPICKLLMFPMITASMKARLENAAQFIVAIGKMCPRLEAFFHGW